MAKDASTGVISLVPKWNCDTRGKPRIILTVFQVRF